MSEPSREVFNTLKSEHQQVLLNMVETGLNQFKAYSKVYPDSSPEAARSSASELLSNPNMQLAYEELKAEVRHRAAVDHDWCLEKLVMLVNEGTTNPGTDNQGVEKGIDINAVKGVINEINKMQGHHAAEKKDITTNGESLLSLTDEQVDAKFQALVDAASESN
jgi:hypothetical protein